MLVGLLVSAGVLLLLAYGAAALYVADALTRSKQQRVQGTPASVNLHYEEAQFVAEDGAILRGWFLESPGARATVILIHDIEGTRSDSEHGLLGLARDYVSHGYHVLTFDLRGRGESICGRDRLGSHELRDVIAAAEYVRERAGPLPLILHGFGFGGSLAIEGVAYGVPAQAVIADSPFTSAREFLRHRWRHIPGHLFRVSCWIARRVYDADIDALVPLEVVDAVAPTPILFIHGDADRDVPPTHTINLAAASLNDRNRMWLVPNVGHCGAYLDHPGVYFGRCLDFIEQAIPARLLVATAG